MEQYSREKIKQRMLKRVALLWDIPDIEHIDPITKSAYRVISRRDFYDFFGDWADGR